MAIIDELISRLGFELDGKEDLREFKRGMNDAEKGAKGFATSVTQMARNVTMGIGASIAAVKGLTAGMFAMANAATGPLDELVKAADRAGVSVEALQELGFAAEQSGASVGEMTSAVEMMSRRLAEAARGQGRAKTALEAYGLSATDAEGNVKSATDFMSELADTFQDLSEAERLDLGQQLGLSRGLITMLAQGNEEIERLRQTARDAGLIFTDEDARNAAAYNDAMNTLMRTVRAMRDRIAIDLLPTLMEMVGGMQEWFNANREVIQQNVGAVLDRIAAHSRTLTEAFGKLSGAGWPVYAVIAAILSVARPLWVRLAIIVGLIDSLLTHMQGGESIIGKFSELLQSIYIPESVADAIAVTAASLAIIAALNPRGFGRLVMWMWRLSGAAALMKALGAGAVLTATATGVKALGTAALIASFKLWPYIAAITALIAAFRALKEVIPGSKLPDIDPFGDMDIPGWEPVNPGSMPKNQQPRRQVDQPNQAAAPEEIPQYGRQTAAESISVPRSQLQPQSLGTQGPETFAERFGQLTDNRDQSTRIEVGGITVNTMSENGSQIANEMVDALQRRAATISGNRPVSP